MSTTRETARRRGRRLRTSRCEARQQPTWPDADGAGARQAPRLRSMPPLVFAGEADVLREHLAAAGRGEAFVLQGGDCAETFAEATADRIRNKIKTILQMAVVLTYGALMPVIKIGRMAGQYAKPRSSDTETRDGVDAARVPGRHRQLARLHRRGAHPDPAAAARGVPHVSASTLNLMRAFTHGGFADLRRVHAWNKGFAANPAYAQVRADGRGDRPRRALHGRCGRRLRRAQAPSTSSRATRRCCSTTSAR